MANNKSAEKRVRQTETRTLRNKSMKTRVKNARRGLSQATAAKDGAAAAPKLSLLASVADKAANRGVIHRNKANRIKSRAAKLVAAAK